MYKKIITATLLGAASLPASYLIEYVYPVSISATIESQRFAYFAPDYSAYLPYLEDLKAHGQILSYSFTNCGDTCVPSITYRVGVIPPTAPTAAPEPSSVWLTVLGGLFILGLAKMLGNGRRIKSNDTGWGAN